MTAQTLTYTVRVFNLPSGVTASHIHVGAPAPPGPVVVNFAPPANASNDFGFTGTVAFSAFVLRPDQGIRSADDMVQAILGGNSYCNVHSTVNPRRRDSRSVHAPTVSPSVDVLTGSRST